MNSRALQYAGGLVQRSRGFSLLEMLLAVLVFGLMASAAYGVLNAMTSAAAAQEAAARQLGEAQMALLRLERELRHTISAGMFSDNVTRPGLLGEPAALEFTFLGPPSPESGPDMRRMQYRYEDRTLYRLPPGGDKASRAPMDAYVLLRGVSRLNFSFMDAGGHWLTRWEPGAPGDLPAGVRLELEIEGLGSIQRLFELPGDRP